MSSTCEGHSHQWDVVRGRGVCADIMMLILANIFILSMITYAFIDNWIQWHPTSVLLPGKSHGWRSLVGCSPWGREESDTTEQLHFHALEKEVATHSSVLAWRIPGTGEPGGLLSMGSHRVGHNWSDLAAEAAFKISLNLLLFSDYI